MFNTDVIDDDPLIDGRFPDVLEALGCDGLAPAVFQWLEHEVLFDELFVFARPFDPAAHPSSVLSSGRGPMALERAQAYCADFYRLDPINVLLDRDDAAHVARIAPSQIADRRYRNLCYDEPEFAEKASVWRRGASHWLVMSLFRSESAGPFSGGTLGAIDRCGRLIFPIVAKHLALRRLEALEHDSGKPLVDRIEGRLNALPVRLTARQLEVCARTVIGMTAEGIALELGVKTSSVVTHRRRAYERLGIATGFELTRLLL